MITEHAYEAPIDIGNAVIRATRHARGSCQHVIGWEIQPASLEVLQDASRTQPTATKQYICCQSAGQHQTAGGYTRQ